VRTLCIQTLSFAVFPVLVRLLGISAPFEGGDLLGHLLTLPPAGGLVHATGPVGCGFPLSV
jgi:hypothetical protein